MPAGTGGETGSDARRALLQTGLELLVETGGAELPSAQSVCVRAGSTRAVFYRHFESRQQFVLELLDWLLTEIVGRLFESVSEGAPGIRAVTERLSESLGTDEFPEFGPDLKAAYLAVMAVIPSEAFVRERHAGFMSVVVDRLETGVREGQAAGEFRADVDPRDVATVIALFAVGAMLWSDAGVPLDTGAVNDTLLGLIETPRTG